MASLLVQVIQFKLLYLVKNDKGILLCAALRKAKAEFEEKSLLTKYCMVLAGMSMS